MLILKKNILYIFSLFIVFGIINKIEAHQSIKINNEI